MAGLTAGGSHVIKAVDYYIETEDVDGAQQQLFSVAGMNLLAASQIRLTNEFTAVPNSCSSSVCGSRLTAVRTRVITEAEGVQLAQSEAMRFGRTLRQYSQPGDAPNSATVSIDLDTGNILRTIPRGGNRRPQPSASEIAPGLQRLMPTKSLENFPITNCSEFTGQNLLRIQGSAPRRIVQFNVDPNGKYGVVPKGACKNCQITNQEVLWLNPPRSKPIIK
jgi:hypothetical protein